MAKIPSHFFKIPWQFPDLEKNLFFPDFSLTRGNPDIESPSTSSSQFNVELTVMTVWRTEWIYTISTMINFDSDVHGDWHGEGMCKRTLKQDFTSIAYKHVIMKSFSHFRNEPGNSAIFFREIPKLQWFPRYLSRALIYAYWSDWPSPRYPIG